MYLRFCIRTSSRSFSELVAIIVDYALETVVSIVHPSDPDLSVQLGIERSPCVAADSLPV